MNWNQVLLAGRTGSDLELRYTGNGTAVGDVNIATNRKYDGKEETTWVNVTFWGKDAENVARFFTKGDPIFIQGRLATDEWEDRQTGQKRTKTKVVCERWTFCGQTSAPEGGNDIGGRDDDRDDQRQRRRQDDDDRGRRRQEPRGRRTQHGREYDSPKDGPVDDDDDDDVIPF